MRFQRFVVPALVLSLSLAACGRKPKPAVNDNTTDTTTSRDGGFHSIAEIDQAIATSPNNQDLWYTRGIMNHDQGDLTSAINDFTRAIQLDSSMASAWHDRGICKHELDDFSGALQDYSSAIALDDKFTEAYYNRAMIYDIQNQREKALADYNKTIELEPNFAPAYYNRGVYYFNTNKTKACEDFKKAADLGDPDGKKAYLQHCQK